ncbi:recombinase family protein [Plebeiibacterium sediminum]|uniref:recombinase family protein n=1 Tax=Plebeiibacterium sediminum TaxID=2992112 RepID=UPI00263BD090|nr:recombinase family protein [Plebeiobacterium sediminum]
MDTTTIQGRLTFNIFASFAEFERELIRERTMAGLKAAREKGRVGGRKPGLSAKNKSKAYAAYTMSKDKNMNVSEILKVLKISKASYYRYIEYAKKKIDEKEKK